LMTMKGMGFLQAKKYRQAAVGGVSGLVAFRSGGRASRLIGGNPVA